MDCASGKISRRNMALVKLRCDVYGEGSVFSVEIEGSAEVEALQEAIFYKQRYNHQYKFPPSALTLYLARKKEGENVKWLEDNDSLDATLRGDVDTQCKKMRSSLKLTQYFDESFDAKEGEIHILVELPPSSGVALRQQSVLWLVRGSVANALRTKGVRCRLYRLAGTYLGYYDPARRTGDKDSALWYEDKTLYIHILFETSTFILSLQGSARELTVLLFVEENALQFENALRDERLTIGSPLNGQVVTTNVDQVGAVPNLLRRIFYEHYESQESESPQDTMSSISLSSSVTVLDASTDEFLYQRIEHERYFLPFGNAESCHLVSRKQSRDHKREFAKYDRDTNNRLALSREMHGYYDGLSYDVPIVNMFPGSVEQNRSIGNRYKVRTQ